MAVNLVARAGDTLLDPCCGSGGIVFEAQRAGVRARGNDVLATCVEMTSANLAWGAAWEAAAAAAALGDLGLMEPTAGGGEGRSDPGLSSSLEGPFSRPPAPLSSSPPAPSSSAPSSARRPRFDPSAVTQGDSRVAEFGHVDAIVSNLPYLRALKNHATQEDDVAAILAHVRSRAKRFAFFSGAPMSPLLASLGYDVISEVRLCRNGKRYLSLCGPGLPGI